jgi:FkbM family methyltransferase
MSIIQSLPKGLRTRGRTLCGLAGSLCVSSKVSRELLNRQLAKREYTLSHWLDRFFRDAEVHGEFTWRYQFGGKTILLPVDERIPRSWRAALAMHNHEPEVTRFWLEYLNIHANGVFFDIGANYGIHSYRFLSHGYQCVVFEPQAECVSFIRRVCSLNGWSPVIVQEVVCERAGAVAFYQSESTWFSSRMPEWVVQCGEEPVRVEKDGITLDEFCAARSLYPTLIKIDVEGGELQVYQGAQEVLRLHHPTILSEILPQGENREAVWDSLAPHGYSAFGLGRDSVTGIRDRNEFEASASTDFVFTCDREIHRRLDEMSRRGDANG